MDVEKQDERPRPRGVTTTASTEALLREMAAAAGTTNLREQHYLTTKARPPVSRQDSPASAEQSPRDEWSASTRTGSSRYNG